MFYSSVNAEVNYHVRKMEWTLWFKCSDERTPLWMESFCTFVLSSLFNWLFFKVIHRLLSKLLFSLETFYKVNHKNWCLNIMFSNHRIAKVGIVNVKKCAVWFSWHKIFVSKEIEDGHTFRICIQKWLNVFGVELTPIGKLTWRHRCGNSTALLLLLKFLLKFPT